MSRHEFTAQPRDLRYPMLNAVAFPVGDGPLTSILMTLLNGVLHFMGTNGYVAVMDSLPVDAPDMETISVPLSEFKRMIDFVKNTKDLKTKPGYIKFTIRDHPTTTGWFEIELDDQGTDRTLKVQGSSLEGTEGVGGKGHMTVRILLQNYEDAKIGPEPFALHPMNLYKMSQLHVTNYAGHDVHVLDMKFVQNPLKPTQQNMCVIKYGPTCRMVIAAINRDRNRETLEQVEPGLADQCLWK